MKNLIFTLLLSIGALSYAQGIQTQINPSDLQSLNTYRSLNTESGFIDIEDINGSPYLNDEFSKGKIFEKGEEQTVSAYMRYSIFMDKFEIKPNLYEDKVFSLKRSSNYEFYYDNTKVILILNDEIFGKKDNGYLFVISESADGYNIYKQYTQDFIAPKKAQTTYNSDRPARLDTEVKYYISKEPNKNLTLIEPHKRKILDAINSGDKSKVKDYIKSNGYKFKGDENEVERQLTSTIEFYNSILD